ncbi:Chondroitin proteoglycan-2 [Orchesella cincta]|uniref:Chondroitin proteoglycan-2 n=1 Tax=Orchesella cincta TaxID=48709 RepID=A0A1D2M929_ORCCI|nr:Chondroitin proteoglycan-2 [Orchesella cincta]
MEAGVQYLPSHNCTKYSVCINGKEFEAFCPRPLYFSSEFQRCDFPENVAECKRGTRPPVISQEEYMQTEIPTEITSTSIASTPKPGFLFECGQTIVANSGTIEYKLYENYDAGELCVFVVRSRNYSSFDFVLERHGISDSDPDAITIMGMDNTYGWGIYDTNRIGPPDPTPFIGVKANEAVVIFKTSTNNGTGFRLNYECRGNPTDYPPGVEVVFNDEEDSPLQVPYQSFNEPSYNYVVLTSKSRMISEPDSFLRLTVSGNFENTGECTRFFKIYSFAGGNAVLEGTFCGFDTDQTVYETKGLFVVAYSELNPIATGTLSWEKVDVRTDKMNK